ncbi:MAG: SCO family protein [Myxococcota bacterium]
MPYLAPTLTSAPRPAPTLGTGRLARGVALFAAASAMSVMAGEARAVAPLDPQFQGVDVDNKLGQSIDKNIPLFAPDGSTTSVGAFFDGRRKRADGETSTEPGTAGRPVLLTLNYFTCASLCSQQLNQLLETLKQIGWAPGAEKFRIVTISFDPADTVDVARGKQESYRVELARAMAENDGEDDVSDAVLMERAKSIDWTFLVGREKAIQALTKNLGYYYRYDEASKQYAHSPVTYVLSPDGVITKYLWGLDLPPMDVKFALMEASDGVLGGFGDKILSSCFVFENGGYHAFAWGFMRIGGGLIALVFGVWLLMWWRRDRKKRIAAEAAAKVAATLAAKGPSINLGPAGAGSGGSGLGPRGV